MTGFASAFGMAGEAPRDGEASHETTSGAGGRYPSVKCGASSNSGGASSRSRSLPRPGACRRISLRPLCAPGLQPRTAPDGWSCSARWSRVRVRRRQPQVQNLETDRVATAQLAVDREIEERELPDIAGQLAPDANGPEVLGQEWALRRRYSSGSCTFRATRRERSCDQARTLNSLR
jgi:hypothetical protein